MIYALDEIFRQNSNNTPHSKIKQYYEGNESCFLHTPFLVMLGDSKESSDNIHFLTKSLEMVRI